MKKTLSKRYKIFQRKKTKSFILLVLLYISLLITISTPLLFYTFVGCYWISLLILVLGVILGPFAFRLIFTVKIDFLNHYYIWRNSVVLYFLIIFLIIFGHVAFKGKVPFLESLLIKSEYQTWQKAGEPFLFRIPDENISINQIIEAEKFQYYYVLSIITILFTFIVSIVIKWQQNKKKL